MKNPSLWKGTNDQRLACLLFRTSLIFLAMTKKTLQPASQNHAVVCAFLVVEVSNHFVLHPQTPCARPKLSPKLLSQNLRHCLRKAAFLPASQDMR